MPQATPIRHNPNETGRFFLNVIQDLLAEMTYLQGTTVEYWFSKIYPFLEVSQQNGEPVIVSHGIQHDTFFNDKEKATVFFYCPSKKEIGRNTGDFEYRVSMFIWYRATAFSKFRAVKEIMATYIHHEVFRKFGNAENVEVLMDWRKVWQDLNLSAYFQESTQPYDCLRINFTTIASVDCLQTWQSDISDLGICN